MNSSGVEWNENLYDILDSVCTRVNILHVANLLRDVSAGRKYVTYVYLN